MSLRASSYAIHVPIPGLDDKVLLVHGLTGAVDLVARDTAAYLRAAASHAPDKPLHGEWSDEGPVEPSAAPPSDETIALLTSRGYLTTRSRDEEHALVAKGVAALHKRALVASFDYVIMPTYGCNLRCGYCFQDHMRTDPRYRHLLTRMSVEMVDRIFAALPDLERQAGATEADRPDRSLLLFGGEPLLAEHVDLVRHIVATARARGITEISAISNATELEAYLDLLGPGGIGTLQITLDGPPEIHDRRRIHADGSGSFAQIADNIDRALARDAYVMARINVDRGNVAELPALARAVIARGWHEQPRFTAYAAAVNPLNAQTPIASTFDSGQLQAAMDELRASFPELAALHRPADGLRQKFMKVFEGALQPHTLFSTSYCGAHTGMYVFDAFGDIYKCWDKTGDPSLRIGVVAEDGTVKLRASAAAPARPADEAGAGRKRRFLPVLAEIPNDLATWQSRSVSASPACARCRFALFCGGGCATNAVERNGSYYTNYCDGFQRNFRRAVGDAYRAHAAGERSSASRNRLCGT